MRDYFEAYRALKKPKSWDYYALLVLLVWPVRVIVYVAPVAFVLIVFDQTHVFRQDPWLSLWTAVPLGLYCLWEVIFTLYHRMWMEKLSPHTLNPPPLRKEFPSSTSSEVGLFERCMKDIPDIKKFVEEWFFDTPFEQLTRRDLRRWFAYVFYSKTDEEMEWETIDTMIDRLYDMTGLDQPSCMLPSANPCIRHTLDEFQCMERPWIAYAVTIGMDMLATLFLKFMGFERHAVSDRFTYWYRQGEDAASHANDESEPIVFVHGIGVGLFMYIPMVLAIACQYPTRQLFLPELRYVSMQLDGAIPTQDETMEAIRIMYRKHNLVSAHWVGHSLGSVICSWVCKEAPECVSKITLIDPVVFLLFRRDVAYNFLYREPSTGLQVIMWYFVCQELHIAYAIRRHFWWYNNILFPEELPRHPSTKEVEASVFLSSCDQITDSKSVRAMLSCQNDQRINVTWWDGLTHGEMILRPHIYKMVVNSL